MTRARMTMAADGGATPRLSPWPGWLGAFLAAALLYVVTANRGAQWQDSGFHIWRAVTGELRHPLGLALAHPLHHALSRLAASSGVLEPCMAVTLISAFAAAVAVANVYGCVLTLTLHRRAALLAAASLGLAHTFWRMATVAETYTLAAALLSAECWCVAAYAKACVEPTERTHARRRGCLAGALLLNGLGIGNHLLALLTTPVLAIIVLIELRRGRLAIKDALLGAAIWLLGSLPYTALVVAHWIDTGDVSGTLRSALFGNSFADEVLNAGLSARLLAVGLGFTLLSFPNFLLPAWLYGMIKARPAGVPPPVRGALLAGLVIHACFVLRYNVVDQHFFFLPLYVLMCLYGGIGFAYAMSQKCRVRSHHGRPDVAGSKWVPSMLGLRLLPLIALLLTPLVYAAAPAAARHFEVLRQVAGSKPYRDDYVYLFTPWSVVERSAERMSRHAVELAAPHGTIIVEHNMAEFAVQYAVRRSGYNLIRVLLEPPSEVPPQTFAEGGRWILVPMNKDNPRTTLPTGTWRRDEDLYVLVPNR